MIRVDLNFTSCELLDLLKFEPKDSLTLENLEKLIKRLRPGNYRFVKFVDPDVVSGDSVLLVTVDFDTDEDRILFMLEWEDHVG